MDLSSAMFSFLSSNQPHSPNTDDPITFLFSSPATDIDDPAISAKLSAVAPHSHPCNVPQVSSLPSNSSVHPSPPSSTIPSCHNTASHLDNFFPNTQPPSSIYDPSLSAPVPSSHPNSFLPLSTSLSTVPPIISPESNSISFPQVPLQAQHHFPESRIQSHTFQSSQPLPQNDSNISLSLSNFALRPASIPDHNPTFSSALTTIPPNDLTIPTPISPAPNSRSASVTHSCGTANQSGTPPTAARRAPGRLRRMCKRDRSLQVMKAIAANNAPDVLLSDGELLEIGAMHESEAQLAQSREIYLSLASFKNILSKYGYRLAALHLDVVSKGQRAESLNEPFDFVLNKSAKRDRSKTEPIDHESPRQVPQDSVSIAPTPISSNLNKYVQGSDLDYCHGGSAVGGPAVGSKRSYYGNGTSDSSVAPEHAVDDRTTATGLVPVGGSCSAYGEEGCVETDQSVDKYEFDNSKQDDDDNTRARKRTRMCEKVESAVSVGQRLGCMVCGKMMSDSDTLVRHFRHTHQGLKPFSCPKCRGFYSSEGTLWHHIRHVHAETPRKYKCSYCDATYDSFGAKTRHEHATHSSGSSQFVCSFKDCGREFDFPAHLESHAVQVHPGFRPFACHECPKSFPSANGLTRHAREVHQRPQAYSCSCNRSYSKRCHLKRHLLRVHGMSVERVQEEMNKQPHPGLLHMVPRAPPASTD